MHEFEEIIESLGVFGPYQIRLFLLVSAFETPAAWAMLLPVFSAATPTWTCPYGLEGNETMDHSNSSKHNETTENGCSLDGYICPGAVFTSDFTSIKSDWNLVCSDDYIPSLIMTVQMIGVLIGACVTGQLADTFGRRKVFFIVYSVLLLSGFGSSFSTSWQLYAVFRFAVGASFGGTMVINFVLPLEFVGRQWRTFCGCIGFWACGVMTQALMAYYLRDWRDLSLASSLGGVLLLLTWWWVPESARWLIQKGRLEEAEVILTAMAKYNKKPEPNFAKLQAYVNMQSEKTNVSRKYSYWDLCRSPSLTKNTIIVMYAWFVSSCVYYGTSLNVGNLSGNRYINFFLSGLVEIPALVMVVLVNNRLGRRKTLCALMLLASSSCFAILLLDVAGDLSSWPRLTTTLAMLGRSGIAGGWAAAQIFSAEVFPTVVRNIGVGASSMSARVGGIVAPQIVFLNEFSAPLPYVVFGSVALLCSLLTLFLPETLNQPLPETLPVSDFWPCFHRNESNQSDEEIYMNGHSIKENGTKDGKLHALENQVRFENTLSVEMKSLVNEGDHSSSDDR